MTNELGNFIKEYRTKHSLSLREFGKIAEISHTHIDSIERGADPRTNKRVKITNETLQKLGNAMSIDPTILFNMSLNDLDNNITTLNKTDVEEEIDPLTADVNIAAHNEGEFTEAQLEQLKGLIEKYGK